MRELMLKWIQFRNTHAMWWLSFSFGCIATCLRFAEGSYITAMNDALLASLMLCLIVLDITPWKIDQFVIHLVWKLQEYVPSLMADI